MKHSWMAVLGGHGGCGASTVAANLAVGLAQQSSQAVLAVDFSLVPGGLESVLGLTRVEGKHIPAWQHPEVLKGFLPRHPSGVEVLNLSEWLIRDSSADWLDYLESCRATYP